MTLTDVRIAYITDQVLPRTATDTRQMVAMASAMGRAGTTVDIVAPKRLHHLEPDARQVAAWYEVSPTFGLTTLETLYPSVRGLEKVAHGITAPTTRTARDADLVYTRTLPILLGALQAGRRVLYETYRPWPDQRAISRPLFRWIARQDNFLGAVLHSHLARDSYARIGLPEHRLLTAWNGYDPTQMQPEQTPHEARVSLGLRDGPTVVYTGRVSLRKGLGLVLDMAEELRDVQFVIVGSEDEEGAVERRASVLGNVQVVPWQPVSKTIPYLYAADVLIIPPTDEPLRKTGNTVLPIKTFLYLAAGRAILAPSTPDLMELLHHDRNAILVKPGDGEAVLRSLRRLLDDHTLRSRLGSAARSDGADLTWDRRAERVLEFIAELI